MGNKKYLFISLAIVTLFFVGLLINVQNFTPAPHLDDLDAGTFLDTLFALALAGVVLFLSAGLGRLIIRLLKLSDWSFIERTVLGLPIGLAIIGYGEFFLGLLGWIQPIHQIAWLAVIAVISVQSSAEFIHEGFCQIRGFRFSWKAFPVIQKVLLILGLVTIILALFLTFTPPWDYDGLMYHLEGPKLFLLAGRIIPIPENWFTYYPSTWEMVYMLGMGLGSDIFARLIHFSTLILLFLATYVFGKRLLPKPGGWISAAIMVGIPILFLWGICAYIDLAWALFQFLAVALFIAWIQDKKAKYVILSGVMQGLALGCKYPALLNAAILGLLFIGFSFKGERGWAGWKKAILNALLFGGTALLIASPWYLKNWIWTGSPIFPLYLPQNIINPVQIKLWMDYVNSFGMGRNWYNFLLLPFSIFFNFEKFGTFLISMDMPSPIFLLCWVYPFIRKRLHKQERHILDILGYVTALQFAAWSFGSQQSRFMISFFPNLSIISSAVFIALTKRLQKFRLGKIITVGLISGMVVSSLIFMGLYNLILRPHRLIIGSQSKGEFLEYVLRDWKGLQFINEELPLDARVFMPWDGKGYYCIDKCLPDMDHSKWTALVQETTDNREVLKWLEENKITHLLLSKEDITYFLSSHNINGIVRTAYEYLVNEFAPSCTEKVYADEWIMILEIDPSKSSCQ